MSFVRCRRITDRKSESICCLFGNFSLCRLWREFSEVILYQLVLRDNWHTTDKASSRLYNFAKVVSFVFDNFWVSKLSITAVVVDSDENFTSALLKSISFLPCDFQPLLFRPNTKIFFNQPPKNAVDRQTACTNNCLWRRFVGVADIGKSIVETRGNVARSQHSARSIPESVPVFILAHLEKRQSSLLHRSKDQTKSWLEYWSCFRWFEVCRLGEITSAGVFPFILSIMSQGPDQHVGFCHYIVVYFEVRDEVWRRSRRPIGHKLSRTTLQTFKFFPNSWSTALLLISVPTNVGSSIFLFQQPILFLCDRQTVARLSARYGLHSYQHKHW